VLVASIIKAMMEIVRTSETSVNFYESTRPTTQKTAIFMEKTFFFAIQSAEILFSATELICNVTKQNCFNLNSFILRLQYISFPKLLNAFRFKLATQRHSGK
jgi:hypothetical protein